MPDKIINRFNKVLIFCLILLTNTCLYGRSQETNTLIIVNSPQEYYQRVHDDSSYQMVELRSLIPDIYYDLRYATTQNFTHTRLYKQGEMTFLRLPAARALAAVQQSLRADSLGLQVFDAYRPYAVTVKMWNLIQDERYVANPAEGSGHNRGLAIDLTLRDLASGKELDMGTGFDNFTDSAHQDFRNLPAQVLANRRRLRSVMEWHGFRALPTEWWHFYWPNDHDYRVLDLDFNIFNH